MALRILSYNVKHLNSIQKWWLALKEFKSYGGRCDYGLGNTLLCWGGALKFASKYFTTSYLASDPTGKAGIAILIRKSCPIQVKNTHIDPHGRFIILDCDYISSSFILVNVYAPNNGQIKFLYETLEFTQHYSKPFMIIGEDFNMVYRPLEIERLYSKIPHLERFSLRLPLSTSALDLITCLFLGGLSTLPLSNSLFKNVL